jgi:hypothetical protein
VALLAVDVVCGSSPLPWRACPCSFIREVREKLHRTSRDEICSLCVGGDLRFEPANIYCCFPTCGVRIKRNSPYYTNDNKKYQVCGVVVCCAAAECMLAYAPCACSGRHSGA